MVAGPHTDVACAVGGCRRGCSPRGVPVSAVRLAPPVHSTGDPHGFVPALTGIARAAGVSAYPGDGAHRWAAATPRVCSGWPGERRPRAHDRTPSAARVCRFAIAGVLGR